MADEVIDVMTEEQKQQEEEADSVIHWATARAGVIVVAPLLGTMALVANQVYMVTKIGKAYGVEIKESAVISLIGALGAAFLGTTLLTLIPIAFLQLPVAVGLTYGLGQVAKRWIKDGMPTDMSQYKGLLTTAKEQAEANVNQFLDHPLKDQPLGDESKTFKV